MIAVAVHFERPGSSMLQLLGPGCIQLRPQLVTRLKLEHGPDAQPEEAGEVGRRRTLLIMPNDTSIEDLFGQDAAVCGAGRQTHESQRSKVWNPNSPPLAPSEEAPAFSHFHRRVHWHVGGFHVPSQRPPCGALDGSGRLWSLLASTGLLVGKVPPGPASSSAPARDPHLTFMAPESNIVRVRYYYLT